MASVEADDSVIKVKTLFVIKLEPFRWSSWTFFRDQPEEMELQLLKQFWRPEDWNNTLSVLGDFHQIIYTLWNFQVTVEWVLRTSD